MKGRQCGQAMPLGIALILFSILSAFVVYNTGQSASQKARLVNAADAAAFSGLQWQARALNFAGYTNRAMVANQVSLAQAVSLASWSTYGMIMAENLARVLSPIPVVNAISQGVETVMSTIEATVTPVAGAMLQVIDKVNMGVSTAQEAMYNASYLATPEIVKAVATQTDSEFRVETAYTMAGVAKNLHEWNEFSERVGDDRKDYDKVRERAQIIQDSRDAFTRARDWSFFDGYLYVLPFFKIDLKKEGETRLIGREGDNGLEWEWKAKDSLSLHTKVRVPFRGWKGVEVPIGYGMAIANAVDDLTIEEDACMSRWDCNTWSDHNEISERMADTNYLSLNGSDSRVEMSGYTELNGFRRLSETTIDAAFPTIKLRVEVELPAGGVSSSNGLVAGQKFTMPTEMPGNAMSSVSVAEVYFKPPQADHADQQGRHIEFANLYSPWWDVRLAKVSEAERLAALTLRGGTDGVSVMPGMIPIGDGEEGQVHLIQGEQTPSDGSSEETNPGQGLVEYSLDTFGEMADQAAMDAANDAKNRIEEQLVGVLEDAVAQVLSGSVSNASGGLVTAEDLKQWADGIRADTNQDQSEATATTGAARQEMDKLQVEFERLDAVVSARFEQAFEEQAEVYRTRTSYLRSTVSGYVGRQIGLFERVPTGNLSEGQRDTGQQLDQHKDALIVNLSRIYRDIVNEETDRFEMDFSMARDFVTTALASYDSQDREINWELFQIAAPAETLGTKEGGTREEGTQDEEENEEGERDDS